MHSTSKKSNGCHTHKPCSWFSLKIPYVVAWLQSSKFVLQPPIIHNHSKKNCIPTSQLANCNVVGGLVAIFLFSHILGIIIPIDFHIFQMGSNHQPVYVDLQSTIRWEWSLRSLHGQPYFCWTPHRSTIISTLLALESVISHLQAHSQIVLLIPLKSNEALF